VTEITDEERLAFVETADEVMAGAGLAPIPGKAPDHPHALVRLYYKPEEFNRQIDATGTFGAVAVCVGGTEISRAVDARGLVAGRARAAAARYAHGAQEMERQA
jgi:hypothetical protein